MFLDCGRKLENAEKTNSHRGKIKTIHKDHQFTFSIKAVKGLVLGFKYHLVPKSQGCLRQGIQWKNCAKSFLDHCWGHSWWCQKSISATVLSSRWNKEIQHRLKHTLNLITNNKHLGQMSHSIQIDYELKSWSLEGVPDTVFYSLCLICVSAKVDLSKITASVATVVRGQKSRLLLLSRLSIICKLAWGAISQTNALRI